MTELKSWFKENQTLVYFLIAQAIAIASAGLGFTSYMVRLNTRSQRLKCGARHIST